MKIGIIGPGNVGQALATGLKGTHEVRFGSRMTSRESPVPGVPVGSRKEAAACEGFSSRDAWFLEKDP